MNLEFNGYRRSNGTVGVRNLVAVIPVSVAASAVAKRVADDGGPNVRATPHQMGASQAAPAREQTERVLAGIGRNPNVAAAVLVELGTEETDTEGIADRIAETGKPARTLSIRESGGVSATVDAGAAAVEDLRTVAAAARRESADVDELVFGVECGGSDATSGIAANPAVGNACDRLVEAGGTASFSETPEFIGAEHILAERCVNDDIRERLLERVERRESLADLMGVDMRGAQPSPGNQEGGLTTIEEKSLGAIAKGGTTPVRGIVDYGEPLPVGGGLVLMDTPGYDVESVVGKIAGGAQVIAFTTGRGSTTGNPIAPVIKVTGNPATYSRMANNMDVNASTILDGEPLESVGERVFETVLDVANGAVTEAERRGMEEFAINEIQPNEIAAGGSV
ncbi:UxaA family hydrolase [Halococcus salsus]|uniref:UxaA family hydrolase n=1 Tax=Halococcus salsus TaxID=2162894 RepID=UPI00135B68B0|nr:UxaA family hydrolase [Halococcus salsus]